MSSPTVTLSQDTNSSVAGVNLKWSYTALSTIREISLIYFKNSSDADIESVEIASGLLKHNIQQLESGVSYSFQLQVLDVLGTMVFSNTLSLTSPFVLSAPVIQSVTGLDESLRVQLASSQNLLGLGDTVEFVLKRADNQPFWIIKPFEQSGIYLLRRTDNDLLVNNTTYRLACMFQPSQSSSVTLQYVLSTYSRSLRPFHT
jgi:hypothetical protein